MVQSHSTHLKDIHYPTLLFFQGFEISSSPPTEDTTQNDDDNNNDNDNDNNEDDDMDSEAQENPWKLSKEEVLSYDDIFPQAATDENEKSEKNKVILLY